MKYDITSTIEDLEQEVSFSAKLVRQRGRLFLSLIGEKKDDGERITVLVPLHEAVSRIVRGFDPDYDPHREEQD